MAYLSAAPNPLVDILTGSFDDPEIAKLVQFLDPETEKCCSFWIHKLWIWTKKILDPEIVEMMWFLDPETSEMLQFLDPEIVKMDKKKICIQKS